MKYLPIFLFAAGVWAQSAAPTAVPQTPAPDRPAAHFDAGQHMAPPAASASPDTVVATFDGGKKLTLGELNSFLAAILYLTGKEKDI